MNNILNTQIFDVKNAVEAAADGALWKIVNEPKYHKVNENFFAAIEMKADATINKLREENISYRKEIRTQGKEIRTQGKEIRTQGNEISSLQNKNILLWTGSMLSWGYQIYQFYSSSVSSSSTKRSKDRKT